MEPPVEPPQRKPRKHLDEINLSGVMAERRTANGKRRLKLTAPERRELAVSERVERAVALFLDVEQGHTWSEIAAELGISVMALKDLTKSEAFIAVWNQHYIELGHDPRLKASQAALTDLLPEAVRELRRLITASATPPATKLNAIREVFELNGLHAQKPAQSDKSELAKFLRDAGLNIGAINLNLPPDYQAGMSEYLEGSILSSDTSDTTSSTPDKSEGPSLLPAPSDTPSS